MEDGLGRRTVAEDCGGRSGLNVAEDGLGRRTVAEDCGGRSGL